MAFIPSNVDTFISGTITAADAVVAAPSGNGVPLTGTSTSGSLVALNINGGGSAWVASITGTLSGTYYFEISIDTTNGTDGTWINVNARQTGLVSTTTVADYKTTVTGEFRGSPAGAKWLRVRNVGGSGLSTTVKIALGTGTGPVFLYSSIPSGTNTIGNVKLTDGTNLGTVKAASTAPITTDTALVTVESPNSPLNVRGSATSAASLPVVIASDQTAIAVKQNDISASGSLASATTVTTATLTGVATASVQVTGTWAGTLTPQVSLDGTTYVSLSATGLINVNTGAYSATIASAATGIWQADIAGFNFFRMNMTTYTSGTAVVTIKTSNATGAVAIDNPLPTGTNSIGSVSLATGNNVTGFTYTKPNTVSSGVLYAKVLSAAVTTPVLIVTGTHQILGWHFYNGAATARYVRFFNVSVSPTMGTTSPTFVIPLPASGGAVLDPVGYGMPMGTGIYYSITTGAADLDNNAPVANDVVGTIWYI